MEMRLLLKNFTFHFSDVSFLGTFFWSYKFYNSSFLHNRFPEKSGSRTAGKEPHPLCDNLRYLAGDYTKYYKDDGICHELYISQLKEWVESEYCHEKVMAIYLYLKKNTLIFDLVEKRIIKLDEQNRIDDKENIQGIVQTKAFVRFIIRSSNPDRCRWCWR